MCLHKSEINNEIMYSMTIFIYLQERALLGRCSKKLLVGPSPTVLIADTYTGITELTPSLIVVGSLKYVLLLDSLQTSPLELIL